MQPVGFISSIAPKAAHNPRQIEKLLRSKGVTAFHFRSCLNPNRNTAESASYATYETKYGVLFWDIRPTKIVPQQIPLRDQLAIQGIHTSGTMVVNVLGNYLDNTNERAYYQPKDLLLLPGVTELKSEIIDGSKQINTLYRISEVMAIVTQQGRHLDAGDYFLSNGQLFLKKPMAGNLSLVYAYNPVWVVSQLMHAVRLIQGNSSGSGAEPTQTFFAPQQLLCQQSIVTNDNTTFQQLFEYQKLKRYYRSTNE